jgi:hypothetical protein
VGVSTKFLSPFCGNVKYIRFGQISNGDRWPSTDSFQQFRLQRFQFDKPPPDPTNIAVKVSGVKAPQDAAHQDGWDYTDATQMSVTVYGSWCNMIQTSASNMVQIVYGCPMVIIN